MRVDPFYVTNLVGSLDQAQANEQQLTAELSSGVRVNSLSQNPVGLGGECAAAQPDSAGRFLHAKREPGYRASCRWPIRLWAAWLRS